MSSEVAARDAHEEGKRRGRCGACAERATDPAAAAKAWPLRTYASRKWPKAEEGRRRPPLPRRWRRLTSLQFERVLRKEGARLHRRPAFLKVKTRSCWQKGGTREERALGSGQSRLAIAKRSRRSAPAGGRARTAVTANSQVELRRPRSSREKRREGPRGQWGVH